MKRPLPLNESVSLNHTKKSKENIIIKNKDKENKKLKSPIKISTYKKSENNYQNKYQKNNIKIVPKEKRKEKITINKIIDNNNECSKNNNNSTIVTPNDKQFLVECLLGNNKNNIDKCQIIKTKNILSAMKKSKEDFKKFTYKVHKSLIPGRKNNKKPKNMKSSTSYLKKNINMIDTNKQKENNNDNDNIIEKNNIYNNLRIIKDYNISKKEEDEKCNNVDNIFKKIKENNKKIVIKTDKNISISNTNKFKYQNKIINSENNIKVCHRNSKSNSNLKIFVNTSSNLKDVEKSSKNLKRKDLSKSVKTPKDFFKKKIINITNEKNDKNDKNDKSDNNLLNKSDNIIPLDQKNNNSLNIHKKNSKKSNSLEKFINNKKIKFKNLSIINKNLFNLAKNKKRNPSSNVFLISKNSKPNKFINKKRDKKTMKENKSCDIFFRKENSIDNSKINIKIILGNNDEEVNKKDIKNIKKNQFNIRRNYFKNLKFVKKIKKHKSQDFNSKNTLNSLVISQNDINNFIHKKENKTPEKNSQKILKSFQKEINNNIKVNNSINNIKKSNYTYNILPGNNGKLIEKCLLNRNNWEIANEDKKNFCNFIWTPLSCQINYCIHSIVENAQFVNHFEYHCELTNKSKTFINLLRYCEFNEINLFSFYPLTIIINFNSTNLNYQVESFKKLYNDLPNLIYNYKDKDKNKIIINKNYIDYFNVNLSKKIGSVQKMRIPKTHYTGKNMWLLKRDNLNRGRKIKVFSNLDDILKEINTLTEQKYSNNLLIQKYIEEPLLYHKRKFDIRIWVLFTFVNCENKYEVYVFKEGHLKACSDEYKIDSDDLFIHLTNYSVQKYNKNFSKTEIGNEISFNDFQKELNEKNQKEGKTNNIIDFRKNIFPEIIKIIALSANSVKGKINLSNRANCFELFGYDFILDINYRPFLLEINTNPGYEESSPLIKMLVPRMIDDALKLTIDKEFEPKYKTEENSNENKNNNLKKSKYEVEGYSSEENMWLKIKTKL